MESFKYVIQIIREEENNLNFLGETTNIEMLEKMLRKYINHEKFRLFWMLSVNFILASRKFVFFHDDHIKTKVAKVESIWDFM